MTAITKRVTKKATVIKMLSRSKGARIDEIANQTDWKPHTVRAFFTGLKKKGFELAREEGPNEKTVYRITSTPAHLGANFINDVSARGQLAEQCA